MKCLSKYFFSESAINDNVDSKTIGNPHAQPEYSLVEEDYFVSKSSSFFLPCSF